MGAQLRRQIETILAAVSGNEEAFNRFAETERLGVFMRHGRLYPTLIGQTHTSRIASAPAWARTY